MTDHEKLLLAVLGQGQGELEDPCEVTAPVVMTLLYELGDARRQGHDNGTTDGQPAMPTTGRVSANDSTEPRNGASPKLTTAPSAVVCQ